MVKFAIVFSVTSMGVYLVHPLFSHSLSFVATQCFSALSFIDSVLGE